MVLADFFAPTAEIELYCKTLETARNQPIHNTISQEKTTKMTNAAFGIRESASYRELKLTFLFFANLDTDSVWIVYISKVSNFLTTLKNLT